MEAIQRAATPSLQVEIPTIVAVTSSNQADLDTAVGRTHSSLDPKVARILSEVVAAMWEVHPLWEILPTALRVPDYSEKPVTQKRLSHACLIIDIQA
jgi:hypothetical protein